MVFANTSVLLVVVAVVGATLGFVVAAVDSASSLQSAFNNVDFVLSKTPYLTRPCLTCICDEYRGAKCDVTELCGSNRTSWLDCDLLGISRYHWSVGGNLTIKGDRNDSPDAYANCKRDPECSARTIQGFLANYEADCNNSVRSSPCLDYGAIHFNGLTGQCDKNPMQQFRQNRFERCLHEVVEPLTPPKSQPTRKPRRKQTIRQ